MQTQKKDIRIVKTLEGVEELLSYLSDKEFVAFDCETTGVEKESNIIGFSICSEVEIGYYVILYYWDTKEQKLVSLETTKNVIKVVEALKSKSLIMQNALFDCEMVLNNYKVDLMPSLHTDTLILGHVLNENRSNGLKERGIELYGQDAAAEQKAMKESVYKNGGVLTKGKYELYKADADLIAEYGAQDAILTLKVFYNDVPILFEQGLDQFFYEDESMPLLRGPTYQLNTSGLKIDPIKLQKLKATLEAECVEAKDFIHKEIAPHVKVKYPGTGKTNHFNIGATQQLSWLLFSKLNNDFNILTKSGKEVCKSFGMSLPYSAAQKRDFVRMCTLKKGQVWQEAQVDKKTGKMGRPKKVGDPWQYMACGKESLSKLSRRYKWVERLLEYKKNLKLLNTYVEGIQERMRYGIIRPRFLQHGTTSGRYSSRDPNFQNLPRDDKRIKGCIVSRPGKIFVGADYSQLEPRVFASYSQDERLLACFKNGDDFYSVLGVEVFNKPGCSLKKDDENSFAKQFPEERQFSKAFGLAATYGATPPRLASITGKTIKESEEVLNSYFDNFPSVYNFMMSSHEEAKKTGKVTNLFGRPRRMPEAVAIPRLFGKTETSKLPYEYRNILNLAVNHKIQSTGASIMNRAAISTYKKIKQNSALDKRWEEVSIITQIHDELVLEGPESLEDEMIFILKDAMENTTVLPGVGLIADPKAAYNLADLK